MMAVSAEKQEYKYHLQQATKWLSGITGQWVQNLGHSQTHLPFDNAPAEFNRGKYK
ncbi:unnamed protein product, partial [marine sediment metagenome]